MSQENVEIVRRAFDAFNRRDLAAAAAVFASDAEWVPYLAALRSRSTADATRSRACGEKSSWTFRTSTLISSESSRIRPT
jgi:ketosteroid isomerase-like protein